MHALTMHNASDHESLSSPLSAACLSLMTRSRSARFSANLRFRAASLRANAPKLRVELHLGCTLQVFLVFRSSLPKPSSVAEFTKCLFQARFCQARFATDLPCFLFLPLPLPLPLGCFLRMPLPLPFPLRLPVCSTFQVFEGVCHCGVFPFLSFPICRALPGL